MSISNHPVLQTREVRFAYDETQTFQFQDISANPTSPLLILGESGKEKTTLLHLLAGLLLPTHGDILIEGQAINGLGAGERDRFRGKHIGLIFQKAHFVPSLNVRENLRLAQSLAGNAIDDQRISSLLSQLNVGQKLNQKPQRLSIGEQQRVAIARAFLNQPDLILADEPTSALDDHNTEQVIQLLETQAAASQTTLVIVTHDQRLKDHFSHQVVL